MYSQLAGCSKLHLIFSKASFASKLQKRLKFSRLRRFLSLDNSDRRRGVAKSITVLFSTTQTHTPVCWCRVDVDLSPITEAYVDFCRRRPPLMTTARRIFSKLHFDWTNLLTGSESVLCRTVHRTPWVLNHLSCGLKFNFVGSWLQKPPASAMTSADWFHCRDVTRHVWLVTLVVSRFFRIFMRAEKQACKQMQCNKAKISEPTPIKGLHNSRV